MPDAVRCCRELQTRLHRLRQKIKGLELAVNSIRLICICLGMLTAAALLEHVLFLPVPLRTLLSALLPVIAAGVLIRLIIVPLYGLLFQNDAPADTRLALRVGHRFSVLGDSLASSLDVYTTPRQGTSEALAEEALKAVYRQCVPLSFSSAVSLREMLPRLLRPALLAAGALAFWLFFSGSLCASAGRLFGPRRDYGPPAAFSLTVLPADTTVMAGSPVTVRVLADGKVPKTLRLVTEAGPQHTLPQALSYRFDAVHRSFNYRIEADAPLTRWHRVTVLPYPRVQSLQITLRPPAYTRLPRHRLEPDEGTISGLKGSGVFFSLRANKPLSRAELRFGSGRTVPLRADSLRFSASFTIREDDSYTVFLLDSLGSSNRHPVSYQVTASEDLPPTVSVIKPARHTDLDERMEVPLQLRAEDDYGLSRLTLVYTVQNPQTGYRALPGPGSGGDRRDTGQSAPADEETTVISLKTDVSEPVHTEFSRLWQLDDLQLLPEDVLTCWFEVWDNDRISGPKPGRSRRFTIRFPSIDEILAEAEQVRIANAADLSRVRDSGKKLQDRLSRTADLFKSGRNMSWEESRELTASLQEQHESLTLADSLSSRLQELTGKLEQQDLLAVETLEKYREMQHLFRQIDAPELREAMQKLHEALEALDQEKIRRAAETLKNRQQQLLDSLDRTIELLKQLQIEQQLDSLISLTEKMMREQAALNEALSADDSLDSRGAANRQLQVAQEAGALETSLEDLHKEMQDSGRAEAGLLDAARQFAAKESIDSLAAEVSSRIRQNLTAQALTGGQNIAGKTASLQRMLKKARESMRQDKSARNSGAALACMNRLLRLSHKQEKLQQLTETGQTGFKEAARVQWSLKASLQREADSLSSLAGREFFFNPAAAQAAGRALAFMEQAVTTLSRDNRSAAGTQLQAMSELNNAVTALLKSLEQMNRSGQKGMDAMEQLMSGFEQMSIEQMGINRQTLEMLNQGTLTMAAQAAASRLAADQQTLKKTLEGLQKEFGERENILGRMDSIIEEMEQAARELTLRDPDRQLIERQQRILSRLLDAQHSLRTRDLSRARQAVSADNMPQASPGELLPPARDAAERFYQDILRLSRDGFSDDYKDLIKKYYSLLSKEAALLRQLKGERQ